MDEAYRTIKVKYDLAFLLIKTMQKGNWAASNLSTFLIQVPVLKVKFIFQSIKKKKFLEIDGYCF